MRIYKFRFWNDEAKRMAFGPSEGNVSPSWVMACGVLSARTIQQWTGLVDKNGVDIYEGDILENLDWLKKMRENPAENPNYDGEVFWERAIVKWYDEYARFGLEFYSTYGGEGHTGRDQHIDRYVKMGEDGAVVIGNVQANPELLT